MRNLRRTVAVLAGLLLAAVAPRAEAQGFQIIVNVANPASELKKDEVAKIFLKTITKWGSGVVTAPCGNGGSKSVTDAFAKAVLGKSASALESYWQQQIFAGKDVPPPEKKTDADVIAFVQATPGAIGYVASSATLSSGVKAVKVN
jgi:ABC-type phosphate transport system substrate-binding protein